MLAGALLTGILGIQYMGFFANRGIANLDKVEAKHKFKKIQFFSLVLDTNAYGYLVDQIFSQVWKLFPFERLSTGRIHFWVLNQTISKKQ